MSVRSVALWLVSVASLACTGRASHAGPSVSAPPPLDTHVPAMPPIVTANPPGSAPPIGSGAPCAAPGCVPMTAGEQRFAIIGDYGLSGPDEASVAALVAKVKPDFVVTTGDNNYPLGGADTIDENIGRYFHTFISPYKGSFGGGASVNRFFPSLGNHDWDAPEAQPYLDYFALPNNERYYETTIGAVQLFALDSDPNEPDGTDADSLQAHWFAAQLKVSHAVWKVVYFHHPPYSSGPHGSSPGMRWPFQDWGASIVYSGHDHTYERLSVAGFPFIVNGVGGNELYEIGEPLPESQVRHSDVHGLVLVTATTTELVSHFLDAQGKELDVLRLTSLPRTK